MGRHRTIHYQHDLTGGQFTGLLLGFRGFALLALAGIAWLAWICVQDWMSGTELSSDQYEITLGEGTGRFGSAESASYEQSLRIVNRSDIALTGVETRQRVYVCPFGHQRLGECSKVVDKIGTRQVELAPQEGQTLEIGSNVYVQGWHDGELVIKTEILRVLGDKDREA